jgi:hypothetical protein
MYKRDKEKKKEIRQGIKIQKKSFPIDFQGGSIVIEVYLTVEK